MKITLKNFEEVINPTVVERGRDYFQRGQIRELEELEKGRWVAIVEGTEDYQLEVRLSGEQIIEFICSCPFDLGPVCKHEVAVFYALAKRGKKPSKISSNKTAADKLNETLTALTANELETFVKNYALQDRKFRAALFTLSPFDNQSEGKNNYRQAVRESLRSAMDRHGFIDYWSTSRAVHGVNILLSQADQFVVDGRIEKAILIYQATIEELVPVLQNADDSNGEIGEAIEWALEKLADCAKKLKDSQAREKMFQYCLREAAHKRYEGWKWNFNFLDMAVDLIDNKKQERRLLDKLESFIKKGSSDFWNNFQAEQAAEIKLKLLQRRRPSETEAFITENLNIAGIRRLSIEQAFINKNWKKVKNLAKEGIIQDSKHSYAGLVVDWLNWLLKVAESENIVEDLQNYAKKLFLETGDFSYYKRLKSIYSKKEWPKIVDRLIKSKKDRVDVPEILIKEKRWKKLLEYVKREPSAYMLERSHKYLAPYFPKELILMYGDLAKNELAKGPFGRAHYQEVCRYLRRMKKLGAAEFVTKLIRQFRTEYKNRRALLEELEKV